MKKRIYSVLTILIAAVIMLSFTACTSSGRADYKIKNTPVLRDDERIDSIDLRFYEDSPHVAFYGMKAFLKLMRQEELTVTEQKDGMVEVIDESGASISVDIKKGCITAPDWGTFQSPPEPYTRMEGYKDSPCIWPCHPEHVFDDEPETVVFDLAKYGIGIHGDKEDVYLPIALLSTMFTDIAMNNVMYNGDNVYLSSHDYDNQGAVPEGYYEGKRMRALLTEGAKREEDEIWESYGELCFIFDNFYGYPGIGALDKSIREKGLDETLKTEDESIRNALLSDDMTEYLGGLRRLLREKLDDGHTQFTGLSPLIGFASPYPEVGEKVCAGDDEDFVTIVTAGTDLMFDIMEAQENAWGDENYRECGSTAIIRIDDFTPEDDEWEDYYKGSGELPDDALGVTISGLKRASENPDIKNILFDLTLNFGGSNDLMSAVLDLLTGENECGGFNTLTGQHQHVVVKTDKNLDGVIDSEDDKVKYDYNYAVLTSRQSFSCGNLFPLLMQKEGAVLIGEPTGGGSCMIQLSTLSSGVMFQMSSYMWITMDENGEPLENGYSIDLPIERIEPEVPSNQDPRFSTGDYSPFYNDEKLDKMICGWFGD